MTTRLATNANHKHNVNHFRRQMVGRWGEFLAAHCSVNADLFNGRGQPCQKCGGNDRFSTFPDFDATGGMLCRKCFDKRNSDGFSSYMWLTETKFTNSVKAVADFLGINDEVMVGKSKPGTNPLFEVARLKYMPWKSMMAYGATVAKRSRQSVVRFPIYDAKGKHLSDYDIFLTGEGKIKYGGKHGLFLADGKVPQPDETVLITEGVKDCAAIHGLGYTAIGMCTSTLANQLVPIVAGVHLIAIPDRDYAGLDGLKATYEFVKGVVASFRVADLPFQIQESNGKDIRDLLKQPDGETLLRECIENAHEYQPEGLPLVYIPGGSVSVVEASRSLGKILKQAGEYYLHGGSLTMVDDQCRFRPMSASTMISEFELHADCMAMDEKGPAPEILDLKTTKAILDSQVFSDQIPKIDSIINCAILVDHDGELVEVSGYDPVTRTLAKGPKPEPVELDEAVSRLRALLHDYQFPSSSDESRAVASLISPLFVFGGLINGRPCVDVSEASASQAGKGVRCRLIAAIYGSLVGTVTQRKGGTGSTQESFDRHVLDGAPFICLDNFRGKVAMEFLESFTTEDQYLARILYQSAIIDPRRTIVQITSNQIEFNNDMANRASYVNIVKQPMGYQFTNYREGSVVGHVRANQGFYLGCVFAVAREWDRQGRPRTSESRHDSGFTDWVQVMDWCIQNIFKMSPLMDGHLEAKRRVKNKFHTWLRQVALAVIEAGRGGDSLRPGSILRAIEDFDDIEIPGVDKYDLDSDIGREQVCLALVRRLGQCFRGIGGEAASEADPPNSVTVELGDVAIERVMTHDDDFRVKPHYAFIPPIESGSPPNTPPKAPPVKNTGSLNTPNDSSTNSIKGVGTCNKGITCRTHPIREKQCNPIGGLGG